VLSRKCNNPHSLTSSSLKCSCIQMMHQSLSLLLAMLGEKDLEDLLFWGTEWGHSLLFNSPSKSVPDFWEMYHRMTVHCSVWGFHGEIVSTLIESGALYFAFFNSLLWLSLLLSGAINRLEAR
jgi:hypothetical protein